MHFLLPAVLLTVVGQAEPQTHVQLGLRLPVGFEVTEYSDGKLADDIYSLTLDPRGQPVVSGRGYLRVLTDRDGDGRADTALDVIATIREGAHDLFWEGDSLFVTADGGLRRFRIGKDGRADGPSTLIQALKTGGEHAAHAIRRGPDGWLYVLCGNNTGIQRSHATLPTSPIADPIAGCVLRFAPDLKGSEIVADGFRNPYGMDFGLDSELFTYDSDNERCVALPWYEGSRFYHVLPGGHYGWRNPQRALFWRLPPYAVDVVPPLVDLGRGSPTGVVCYRHTQFPPPYRGAFFLLDWTFGRIHLVRLTPVGSSYRAEASVFLEAVGENGFAPTAAVVHPGTGDLYVSIGGRGTRGGVYCIRYPAGRRGASPLSVVPAAALDWVETRHGPILDAALRGDDVARRRALVEMIRFRKHFLGKEIQDAVAANAGAADRYVRQAAANLAAAYDTDASPRPTPPEEPAARLTTALAWNTRTPAVTLNLAAQVLATPGVANQHRLDAVRIVQLGLGDLTDPKREGTIWEGYTPRKPLAESPALPTDLRASLRAAFPAKHADLDRELARTLALLEDDDPATLQRVVGQLTPSSGPLDDIHYLAVAARLRGPRSEAVTTRVADALLGLDRKLTERKLARDRHWPQRVAELHEELARKDARLNGALLDHAEFGRADHALFAAVTGFDRRRAAEVFLSRGEKDESYPWNETHIPLLADLPPTRTLPLLRQLWERGGLEEALLPALARHAEVADRGRFVAGLTSPRLATVRLGVEALDRLPPSVDADERFGLVKALRGLGDGPQEKKLRERLVDRLRRVSGEADRGSDPKAWTEWFARAHPDRAARLTNPDGVDVAAWSRRLGAVDWSGGEVGRGKEVFARASCAACHSGTQALGPDLQGVAGRFSRDDLFAAIVQPSKDVSNRYRALLVQTADGKVHQGLIIYEAVDSLILQTGAATTVRLTNPRVEQRRESSVSLMPAGLLDRLTDPELADLYAYLKSLGAAKAPAK